MTSGWICWSLIKYANSICPAFMLFVWLCSLFWIYFFLLVDSVSWKRVHCAHPLLPCSHCHEIEFNKQTITSTYPWHDRWINLNMQLMTVWMLLICILFSLLPFSLCDYINWVGVTLLQATHQSKQMMFYLLYFV
jgi:hypothetical protein